MLIPTAVISALQNELNLGKPFLYEYESKKKFLCMLYQSAQTYITFNAFAAWPLPKQAAPLKGSLKLIWNTPSLTYLCIVVFILPNCMWTKGDVTLRVYISCCYVGRFACRDIWALLYKIRWLGVCLRIFCKWTYKGAKINTLGETVTVAFPAWSAALLSRKQLLAFFQWTTWYVATGLLMKSRHNIIHYFCDVHVPLCSLCIVRILIMLFNEERD